MLSRRFPSHPDFDPNGRGQDLRLTELDTVAGATLKIANPLKLGAMYEAAFGPRP